MPTIKLTDHQPYIVHKNYQVKGPAVDFETESTENAAFYCAALNGAYMLGFAQATINGADTASMSDEQLRAHLAMVRAEAQRRNLTDLTN
jgi:hypothetical protein